MKTKEQVVNVPYTEESYTYELDQEKFDPKLPINWKLGDFCICRMEVKQITGIDKESFLPCVVSCGYFRSSCSDWTPHLFPLTLKNKNIAAYFYKLYHELHKYRGLNFSDLFSYFCYKFEECIAANPEEVQKKCDEIREFQEKVIEKVNGTLDGINIFRN